MTSTNLTPMNHPADEASRTGGSHTGEKRPADSAQAKDFTIDVVQEEKPPTDSAQTKDRPNDSPQQKEDDSDGNDKFWTLFLEETRSAARYKVDIWKTELDNLLVFAGLFAGVVSSFLIDLRSRIYPTGTRQDMVTPSSAVTAAGFLWYGSLVVTLIGALWGVLAQRWHGEFLREIPNNRDRQALERWKRDEAARDWYMEHVITGVPLLTQIALGMFLAGFVAQSFDDNHDIGIEVAVLVGLGAVAYVVVTILPWILPDCPYRTPLTELLRTLKFTKLFPPPTELLRLLTKLFRLLTKLFRSLTKIFDRRPVPPTPAKDTPSRDSDTRKSKIQILVSRLNHSSNDDIFSAAASMLDIKLESKESYKDVQTQAPEIADALSARLRSFAHQVQKITAASSLSVLKGTAPNGEAFLGTLYSPIDHGIICLRVLLRCMEVTISEGSKSPWVDKGAIVHLWISSKNFPAAWRLLSWSADITRLVATDADYRKNEIITIDWDDMIRTTFSDLTLRSVAGFSMCRGLFRGKENVKRGCALGLVMFTEVEATMNPPKDTLFEGPSVTVEKKARVITEKLWSELMKIWKEAAVELLKHTNSKRDEKHSFAELLNNEMYETEVSEMTPVFFQLLGDSSSSIRIQAIQALAALSKRDVFKGATTVEHVIAKVAAMCGDKKKNVRDAAIAALVDVFIAQGGYQREIILSIPTIIQQLDHKSWDDESCDIREQSIKTLKRLGSDVGEGFQKTLNELNIVSKLVAMLKDDHRSVRAAATEALQALAKHTLYQPNIKSTIPAILETLNDDKSDIRKNAVQILVKFSELEVFQKTIDIPTMIFAFVTKLIDADADVRRVANTALQAYCTNELYYSAIDSSIPTLVEQLWSKEDVNNWNAGRWNSARLLTTLSKQTVYHKTIRSSKAIEYLICRLDDKSYTVRNMALEALLTLGAQSYFDEVMSSPRVLSDLRSKLEHSDYRVHLAAAQVLCKLGTHHIREADIKNLAQIFVADLQYKDWETRQRVVQVLTTLATDVAFKPILNEEIKSIITKMFTDDSDKKVRAAVAQALLEFEKQGLFQDAFKSVIIPNLKAELTDDSAISVYAAALPTLLVFSEHPDVVVFTIPAIMKFLEDEDVVNQRRAMQMLAKIFSIPVKKPESVDTKLDVKPDDSNGSLDNVTNATSLLAAEKKTNDNVPKSAADPNGSLDNVANPTSLLAAEKKTKNKVPDPSAQFLEILKNERVFSKLVAKLSDEGIRASVHAVLLELGKKGTKFLQEIVSTLYSSSINDSSRAELYKILIELRPVDTFPNMRASFLKVVDEAVIKLLANMKDKDLSHIRRSITILAETTDKGLIGVDLTVAKPNNNIAFLKTACEVVGEVVQSKLVYSRDDTNREESLLALSQLARNEVLRASMKPAIPSLMDAISRGDWSDSVAAFTVVSELSGQAKLHLALLPAVEKFIRRLSERYKGEDYSPDLIEAISLLGERKLFQSKLKPVVLKLIDYLPHSSEDAHDDATNRNKDNNTVALYKAACKLISKFCEKKIVGRELVPLLVRVLSNMDVSFIDDLLRLFENLVKHGGLTINDRAALASSLRIGPHHTNGLEVQLCKLKMAALLHEAHRRTIPQSSEYQEFLGAVLGKGNDTIESELSDMLGADMLGASNPPQGAVQVVISQPHEDQTKQVPSLELTAQLSI